jgi:hypothetical protein
MLQGKLTRIEQFNNKENSLPPLDSGNFVEGEFESLPVVGKKFVIDNSKYYVMTSEVKEVLDKTENSVFFKTLNSVYKLVLESKDKT